MIVHYNHFECYIASSECHGEIVVANANYSNVFDHALEIGLENRRLHFSRCLLLHYRAHYSRILITLSKNDEALLATPGRWQIFTNFDPYPFLSAVFFTTIRWHILPIFDPYNP